MKMYILFTFILVTLSQAKNTRTIDFINSYIKNERAPTEVVINNLGWEIHDVVDLVKTLGVRHSSVFRGQKTPADRRILFIVDLDVCDVDVLKNITVFFRSPFRWLVISKIENMEQNKFLWELPLLADSDFVLAVKNKKVFTLTELYKPSSKGPTHSTPRGHYNGTLVDTRARRELYRRRRDLKGHTLTVSYPIQDSNTTKYHMLMDDRLELQYDAVTKIIGILIKLAVQNLNATPHFIFRYDYGTKRNGKWTGMMKDIVEGKADIGTATLLLFNRLEAATYTDTVVTVEALFIFRQPPLSEISNIFLLPLSIKVWIAVFVCIVISIAALHMTNKWETKKREIYKTEVDGNIIDAVLMIIGAVSQQGYSNEPRTVPGRITFLLIFIFTVVLFVAYSANLLTLLQAPANAIRTIEQLAQSKITLAAIDAGYSQHILQGHNDLIRKTILKKIIPDHGKKNFCQLDECITKLRQGSFAFHAIMDSSYRRIEETFFDKEKCDLTYIDFLKTFPPFLPIYKDSPYIDVIKVTIKRIKETGCWRALDKRYTTPRPKCDGKASAFITIGFQNMRPVILLLLIGIAASVMILIIEIIVHRIVSRRKEAQMKKQRLFRRIRHSVSSI